MPDWADTEASNFVEHFTIMKGDRLVALKGEIEAALAIKLRVIKIAATIETVEMAEANVASVYARPAS